MDDDRLARVAGICLALPEVVHESFGRHSRFAVRRRTFAYFLDDHHGDGIVGLACKAPPGLAPALIEEHPERYYRPAYLGHQGWAGLRLDVGEVDWSEVEDLLTDAYLLVAPKSVVARLRSEE